MEEHNEWLTSGLSAVYQPDEKRSLFLAASQWTDAFLSLEILFMPGMSWNFEISLYVVAQLSSV